MQRFDSVKALTCFVEGQSHQQRCKTLIEVGRSSVLAAGPDAAALQHIICEMAQPTQVHYHRLLSAYALRGAFAVAQSQSTNVEASLWSAAVLLLNDPSAKVAQLVMSPLLTAVTPSPPAAPLSPSAFLASARLPQFKFFVVKLRQCGRQAELVQLYGSKLLTDPVKQQYLLGFLKPADFEKLSEEEQASLDSAALRLLCRAHGAWVARYLTRRVETQVAATQTVTALLRKQVMQAFTFLSNSGSARHALTLFTSTAHLLGLRRGEVSQLLDRYFLRAFPVEVGTYLLEGEGSKMLATLKNPLERKLSLRAVKRMKGQTDLVLRMMEKGILCPAQQAPRFLPAEVRQRIYDTARNKLVDHDGVLSSRQVERLPRVEDRVAEARANYAHRELQDNPMRRLAYLTFLPLPEGLKLGDAYVTSNDVNIRIEAVTALLCSLRYYPEHVDAALDFCLRRTKEQDPWKGAMYSAWNGLPCRFWRTAAGYISDVTVVEKLDQLLSATYSAKDLSDSTLREVQKLLCGLLGAHTGFALPQLVRLIDKQKMLGVSLGRVKPFGYIALEYPQVLPAVASAMLDAAVQLLRMDKAFAYVRLLEAFFSEEQQHVARVLLRAPGVQDAVKATLHIGIESTDAYAASSAFTFYYRHFPADMVTGLPALLEKSLDWVTQDGVQQLVCDVLQGPLLDRFVVPISNIPTGRFYHSENNERLYLCKLPLSKAYRWTAAQQQHYAASILQLIYSKNSMSMFHACDFVNRLAQLPSVSSTTSWRSPDGVSYSLQTLATQDHPEHGDYLKGFALHALGLLEDDATAVMTLQAALKVPATRLEALRALALILRRASSAETVTALEPLLTEKGVTTQKEAIYLLGSKRDEVAYSRLVRFAAEQQLPMPEVDAEGKVVGSPEAAAEEERSTQQQPPSPSSPAAMHRDVRTAFVTTLFHFLAKPQVWAFYNRLVAWDCSGAAVAKEEEEESNKADTAAVEADAAAAPKREAEDRDEEDGAKDAEGGDAEERVCPSAAACVALTTMPWVSLCLPWQLSRYQSLLAALLQHPQRHVRIAALHKLALSPPHANLELCKAAEVYLDNCTDPSLVRSALRCMMSCTANETVPYVVSSILNVQADPSLQIVTQVLVSLTSDADALMKPRCQSVVEGVVRQLMVAHRQPTLIVKLIYALPPVQLVAQLTALEGAGILHVGAACAAVNAVRSSGNFTCDLAAAEHFEASTLRCHPSAVLRRIGLEVVLLAGERDGWTDERRAAVETYRRDADLWVSSDALVVRMA